MQPRIIDGFWTIAELAKSLRRENLFIANEQRSFLALHETYKKASSEILQITWICAHQRQILNNLIVAKSDCGPTVSCQRVNMLKHTKFVDIHQCKVIKYAHIMGFVELIKLVYESPRALAHCLTLADRVEDTMFDMDTLTAFIVNGLYGSIIHPKDAELMIKLLQALIEMQIVTSDNPRRLLRAGSSSFARLYQKYHESSFSAKLFLKTILFEPIMSVLMHDEIKLEVDAEKILAMQKMSDSVKMFGAKSSIEFSENLQKYTSEIVDKLSILISKFIQSMKEGWYMFPFRTLIQSMYHFLTEAKIPNVDVHIILTDMIFTNFICPAILSPHMYGIIDAPISENTRFNLIQIGQILQSLALIEFQPIDAKLGDLIDKLDKQCVNNLLKKLYQQEYSGNFENMMQHQNMVGNKMVLATLGELINFRDLLKYGTEGEHLKLPSEEISKLKPILDQLPNLAETIQEQQNISLDMFSTSSNGVKPKAKLKGRVSKTRSLSNSPLHSSSENSKKETTINSFDDKGTVFIMPITDDDDGKLLSEEELLNNIPGKMLNDGFAEPFVEQMSLQSNQNKTDNNERTNREKHKNFALHQDDASIGNTSDNLEAVSEAHSNHSVASSLELEEADQNYNDNLSDMISANVSGRGTPNISGRDTPSSQVTEGGNEVQQFATPQMTKILNKTRSDIEDKFCKFEIKKLIEGDETISIISDTWSTDVLASDSEALEANDRNFSTPLIPTTPIIPGDQNYTPLTNSFGQLRLSTVDLETQSESAWSTDAVMDTEDSQSVTTRSDTTDSIARDDIPSTSNKLEPTVVHTPRTSSERGSSLDLTLNARDNHTHEESSQYLNCIQSSVPHNRQKPSTSSSNKENKARTVKSYVNEITLRSHSIDKTINSKLLMVRDKNFNNSKSNDPNDYNALSDDTKSKNRGGATNDVVRTNVKLINPFSDVADYSFSSSNVHNNLNNNTHCDVTLQNNADILTNSMDDELSSVEHRRLSSEHRNAKFDSRRNGMMDYLGNFSSSFNYEDEFLGKDLSFRSNNGLHENNTNYRKSADSELEAASSSHAKMGQSAVNEPLLHFENDSSSQSGEQQNRMDTLNPTSLNSSVTRFNGKAMPGTITKSISFDSSADKNSRSGAANTSSALEINRSSDGFKTTNGFFTKIKLGFKNRRSVNVNNKLRFSYNNNGHFISMTNCDAYPSSSCTSMANNSNEVLIPTDTTEDILSKYRRKTSSSSETATSDSTSNNSSSSKSKNGEIDLRKNEEQVVSGYSTTFSAAKKKLRVVLSSTEIFSCSFEPYSDDSVSPLLMYLRVLQSQALSNHNLQQLTCISELFRCMDSFDFESQEHLLKQLQNDMLIRQAYTQYLMNCRQAMLSTIDVLESFNRQLETESHISVHHILMVSVKMFLEKKEQIVSQFCEEFIKLTIVDEKIDLLHEFMNTMMLNLECDAVLSCLTDWQTIEARRCMECILLHRLYYSVMFPNEDGDLSRDRVLSEHINRLTNITPSHVQLRISAVYLNEAPWPFAQRQLSYISAYKTPQEKVACVIKCIKSLISLLSMGSDKPVAADDIIPVLIYVIIQTNPPNLLSTIEYVNCFVDEMLQGENQYWWTQFCSAVTFIKTLDYCE
ncbi:receptor-mediated endocytosis protein 6 homolog [Culex pipiens pallens]|uniref:Receptor-mediated endocytosis protein 6 homolog n=2 Tax=Culex pipiens TaxID=7175 RepID=A0A8D8BNL5_CULPI|nr:receptor-mediated endocytosis protein 6 homolog [Culex pipiens pallens]